MKGKSCLKNSYENCVWKQLFFVQFAFAVLEVASFDLEADSRLTGREVD